jgi:hypothetical protein
VLKNSSMSPWSPVQGLKDPFSAVFWPWFSSVGFAFDLPTGQIVTFSTGWSVLRSSLRNFQRSLLGDALGIIKREAYLATSLARKARR